MLKIKFDENKFNIEDKTKKSDEIIEMIQNDKKLLTDKIKHIETSKEDADAKIDKIFKDQNSSLSE